MHALKSNTADTSNGNENERDNMRDIHNINECNTEFKDLNFKEAIDRADIEAISRLAYEIWHDHYMPIIGVEQVRYMLSHFQNVNTISNQIASGYRYYLILRNETPLAYFAILADAQQQSMHISKLYVRLHWQRKGLGNRMLTFIEAYCRQHGLEHIWLTVNRHNQQAIDFYLRNKFVNAGILVQDIGAGFVMDDYKMVKNLR